MIIIKSYITIIGWFSTRCLMETNHYLQASKSRMAWVTGVFWCYQFAFKARDKKFLTVTLPQEYKVNSAILWQQSVNLWFKYLFKDLFRAGIIKKFLNSIAFISY